MKDKKKVVNRLLGIPNVDSEGCECGGIAKPVRWDEGNERIPILKCESCGDEFEAHETKWRGKNGR